MEGNNMVVEQPKKKSNALLVFLMFLIGIGIGFGANYGMSYFNKDVDKKESSVTEDTTKTDKLELLESTKAKMEMIVEAATRCSAGSGNCDMVKKFFDKVDKLDNEMKYTITWNTFLYLGGLIGDRDSDVVDYSAMDTSLTKEQYNLLKPNDGLGFPVVSKSYFDNVYRQLFNEKPSYSIEDIDNIGCPSPIGVSESLDKIYYSNECGGTGYAVSGKVKSFDVDGDNYLVHSEITESTAGKDDVVYKILWKFDKDLNFVSTEKE